MTRWRAGVMPLQTTPRWRWWVSRWPRCWWCTAWHGPAAGERPAVPESCLFRERTPWLDFSVHHTEGALMLAAEAQLRGPLAVLVGPSGAGKTSLLRAIAGLMRPRARTKGHVHVAGGIVGISASGRWLAAAQRGC